jgi:hypothetical protein
MVAASSFHLGILVELSIGNGEVDSSILSGSTSFSQQKHLYFLRKSMFLPSG